MDGNTIWNNLLNGWGLGLAGVGFVIIIVAHFLGKNSSLGKTIGFAAIWAVLLAILFNIETLLSFGESVWGMFRGA